MRLRVGENVVQFALAVKDIDRNENDTKLDAGQIQVDHLDAVGHVDTKPVAGFQAAFRKQIGQTIAARVDVAESVRCAFEFKRRCVASADEGQIEKMKEIQKVKVPRASAGMEGRHNARLLPCLTSRGRRVDQSPGPKTC